MDFGGGGDGRDEEEKYVKYIGIVVGDNFELIFF